jgi:uncharacterized membrane protein YGL010W
MSPVLKTQFADYAAYHGTAGNRACHFVGIPLIVLTVISLLAQVPLATLGGFTLTLAEVVVAAATVYYLTLDPGLAVLMVLASAAFDLLGRQIPPLLALGVFVFGWVLQFVGHYVYEKKSPAFFRNLTHLLVGPLWILAKVTGRA